MRGNGPGANNLGQNPSARDMTPDHNLIVSLDQWVSKGVAPKDIIASRLTDNKVTKTHPVCPYPQSAKWDGKGSPDDAKSFSCVTQD